MNVEKRLQIIIIIIINQKYLNAAYLNTFKECLCRKNIK